jgi:peptidoglycan/xylan/chitin deacetylase (PgdA/CDA1 family)
MYHYVRNLKHSRYPNIRGLDLKLFKEQIGYLKRHYNFITMEMLIDSIDNKSKLPNKSVLLTFDDGYADHFNYVFPLLNELKIQGSFFPPVRAINDNKILDVNKIHYILASELNTKKIIKEIKIEIIKYKEEYKLENFKFYLNKLAFSNRLDNDDVVFIKRILQLGLDPKIRKIITNNIFEKIVGINEECLSRELYMNIDQIRCMHSNGMHIGSHTYNHDWLSSLNKNEQEIEIINSKIFLEQIGCDMNNWTMCYPFGDYNDVTIDLLKKHECKLALTTEVDIANISKHNRYTLPRLDTNDIPKESFSKPNTWFVKG